MSFQAFLAAMCGAYIGIWLYEHYNGGNLRR